MPGTGSDERLAPTRKHRMVWAAAAVAVLALLVGGAILASRSAVDGVTAFYDAEPLHCEGSEVFPYADEWDDTGATLPSVVLAEGMECSVRVLVRNDGWADVSLDAVRLTAMGRDAALGMRPMSVSPNGDRPQPIDGIDMRVPLTAITLPAGESMMLESRFEYLGDAKLEECSSASWTPATVEFSAFGSSRTATPPLALRFAQGDPRECAAASG